MIYQIARQLGSQSIFVMFGDGESADVPGNHPRFEDIAVELLRSDRHGADPETAERAVRALIANNARKVKEFTRLSERVTLRGGKLYFDGDRIKGTLTKHIVRMAEADEDCAKLVNFLEKLQLNPSEQSREQLYRWLNDREFTITDDGDFLAYKGLTAEGGSINHGTAIVDGVPHKGSIPNPVGAVVEMPRLKVDGNREVGCSQGLHAGTFEYASSFSKGKLVRVAINPRDVVSVPDDCQFQKLRVCRYVVLEVNDAFHDGPVYSPDDDDEFDGVDLGDDPDADAGSADDEPFFTDEELRGAELLMADPDAYVAAVHEEFGPSVRRVRIDSADTFPVKTIDDFGNQRWLDSDGRLDRTDGPAHTAADGYQAWYTRGKLDRLGGPAVVNPDGTREFWARGERIDA